MNKQKIAFQGKVGEEHTQTHPRETVTVLEKRRLFNEYPEIYKKYGDIIIVQGSALSYQDEKGNDKLILYFHNGEERINFPELKLKLGIPKKTDLRFYQGNLEDIGLANGEVSPLSCISEKIDGLYFDERMIKGAQENPSRIYDIALSKEKSLFVNVADVYKALIQKPTIREKMKLIEIGGNESELEKTVWRNLAPSLTRQRLIIEGTTEKIVKPRKMKSYLLGLADVTDMDILSGPYAYSAHECGYGGWVHWKTSGAHIYSYPTNPPLVTIDTYTCKPFSVKKAVEFTKKYLSLTDLVLKEIEV